MYGLSELLLARTANETTSTNVNVKVTTRKRVW